MNVAEKRVMADSWQNFDIFADRLHCRGDCCAQKSEDELIEQMPDELFYLIDEEVQPMRADLGLSLSVNSAHRCERHPDELKKKRPGPHQEGAIDLGGSHKKADKVLQLSYHRLRITGRGINQKGAVAGRFIHLDRLGETKNRPRPHLWTY